ncbi:MAG TPA: tetratricopeptide repeat protein [Pyrinomonadaceae bacterium]
MSALLLAATLLASGCTNKEAAKANYLKRGETYLKDKKYQEATIEFRNAIQIDDRLAAAHWGLAQAYEKLERFQEAFDELKRVAELDSNNLDALARLGNFYLAASKTSSEALGNAERIAQEILKKNPNHIDGHVLMGSVFYAQNKRDEALKEMNRAIELDPGRVESYLSLARLYVAFQDGRKAEETFQRAISLNASSGLAHKEYARFLAQTGRPDDAEREFKKAIEVEPNDRDARFVLASFYLVNGKTDKAEEAYKALADLDKDKPDGRAVLADFYSSVGRQDEAVKIYQDILAQAPDYTRGHYRLGEIMLMRGDLKAADSHAEEVLKKNPHDMQALLLRARLRMQSGQTKDVREAIEALNDVLKQEPNSRAGLYFMSQAQFMLGQVEQARAFAGDLQRYYPDYLPGKLMQVQINLGSRDYKTAQRLAGEFIERLKTAVPDKETSPQMLAELRAKAYTARASAELQLNDLKAARADFEAARGAAPNDPASYVNLAAAALAEKKNEEAVQLYDRALSIDIANFDALNGLIGIYARQKQLEQAHARVDRALASQPNRASLHYLKGQVYGYESNAQGAETELRKTIELDDKYLAAYSALGALYVNTRQQERAVAEFRKIVEREPNAAAYTLMGMLESERQNFDAAIDSYKKALDLDPNAAFAANNLAWIYAAYGKGNLDEAVRLAQGVVQKYPDDPSFADTLGWVYYKKGLHAAAVEQLQRVVQKAGGSASYRYHLGMALAGKGDRSGARREIEQALRLGEKDGFAEADDARKALATL